MAASPAASSGPAAPSSYGRGARILSIGIATTGLVTFAFFAVASHVLDEVDYKGISLLWSVLFIVTSVIYRPIEQLLSRTIADRDARGQEGGEHLRVAALIQLALAAVFAGNTVTSQPSWERWRRMSRFTP